MRYPTWQHVTIRAATRPALEQTAAGHLGPALDEAISKGVIIGYHFLRKDGGLRLRICPDTTPARTLVGRLLAKLVDAELITDWTLGIYEPETYTFGGQAGMDLAHELFCTDSRLILSYLALRPDDSPPQTTVPQASGHLGRRECALLLASAMMRAEGLDWCEQGDVWAKILEHRPDDHPLPPEKAANLKQATYQLLTLDTAQNSRLVTSGPLSWAAEWISAFEFTGRALTQLARGGELERGQRAVTAHHLVFHFNRLGLSARDQATMARLAKEIIMNDDRPASRDSAPVSETTVGAEAATLGQMDTAALPEAPDEQAIRLRAELTTALSRLGSIRTEPVASAFREVPRHLFVPSVPLAEAYANDAVYTKHDETGVAISALSQPAIVALMLEQLDVRPGQCVLELGAGTGYNAALLGHLVGPTGHVITIDVDDDLVDGANEHLKTTGALNVEAVLADGALGYPDSAPYDRITATVGAGDVPANWLDQLTPGGRLLIPLRLRGGISRSIALEFGPDGFWHSKSIEMCTFMPLRGIADDARQIIPLTEDGRVTLHVHREQPVDPDALGRALDFPPAETFTGVTFGSGDSFEQLDLYLACALPGGISRMPTAGPAVDSGRLRPQFGWGAMTAVDTDSIAYLTLHQKQDGNGEGRWEIGTIGHGPRGAELAGATAEHIRTWDSEFRTASPTIRIAQGEARDKLTGRFTIDKPHTRIAVDWH